MRRLLGILPMVLLLVGCGPDRGQCLKSHPEKRRYPQRVGKITTMRTRTVQVCDVWEFPQGKPEHLR